MSFTGQTAKGVDATVNSSLPAPPDSFATEFSQANVFVLFLTLGSCLLVQPCGSLIYTKPRSIVGRTIFFFWRLNPLATAVEAILVVIALVDGVRTAFERQTGRLQSGLGFWRELHATLLAIQLLRVQGRSTQQSTIFPGETVQQAGIHDSLHSPRTPTETISFENTLQATLGLREGTEAGSHSANNTSPVGSLSMAGLPAPGPALLLHIPNRTDIEAYGSDSVSRTSARGNSRMSTSSLMGQYMPFQAQLLVDIYTTLSVLAIFVRLASVAIPLHISIPAWLMVAGWVAVQVLHLVCHWRNSDFFEPNYIIHRSRALSRVIYGRAVWSDLSFLLLPVFGYLTYVMLFKTGPLPLMIKSAYSSFCIPSLSFAFILPNLFVKRLSLSWFRYASRVWTQVGRFESAIHLLLALLLSSVFSWALGYGQGSISAGCLILDRAMAFRAYAILSVPYLFTLVMVWAWFFIPTVPLGEHTDGFGWLRTLCLLYGLVTTVVFFAGALVLYDGSGTYKPEWSEWLG